MSIYMYYICVFCIIKINGWPSCPWSFPGPWLWTDGPNPSDVYLVEAIGDLRIQKTTSGIA